jgi:hypothetical protein
MKPHLFRQPVNTIDHFGLGFRRERGGQGRLRREIGWPWGGTTTRSCEGLAHTHLLSRPRPSRIHARLARTLLGSSGGRTRACEKSSSMVFTGSMGTRHDEHLGISVSVGRLPEPVRALDAHNRRVELLAELNLPA